MAASMNATARLLGVSHRVHISSAEAPDATPSTAATPPPQKHAKRALRYMSDAEIAAYVSEVADTIQFEGSVMPGVEALVYGHCVKIVLSLVHEALDALPAFGVLGLRLDVAPQKRRGLDLVEALRRRRGEDDAHGKVRVDEERVRAFVDRVLEVEREASGGGAIGDFERSLHHNVCAVVVNLAADVASTIRLGCFGHDLTLDVRPIAAWLDTLTTEELRRRRRAGLPQLFGEAHVAARSRRSSRTSPCVSYVPDVVERTFIAGSSASAWADMPPRRRPCWTSTWPWRCGCDPECRARRSFSPGQWPNLSDSRSHLTGFPFFGALQHASAPPTRGP